jgi:hypothetical protein
MDLPQRHPERLGLVEDGLAEGNVVRFDPLAVASKPLL